jgi:hypothetical protein
VPSSTPIPVIIAGEVIVGDIDNAFGTFGPFETFSSFNFARPKSSTFTTSSGVILMFAGFRSR